MAKVERQLRAGEPRRPTPERLLALAALAGALLFAVGIGGGRSLARVGGPGRLASPSSYVGDLLLTFVALGLVGFGVLVYSTWPGRRRRQPEDEPERVLEPVPVPWWTILLVVAAALAAVGGFVAALLVLLGREPGTTQAPSTPATPSPRGGSVTTGPEAHTGLPVVHWWGIVGAVVVAVLAAAGAWSLARRRPEGPVVTEAREAVEVREVIELSLEEIEREPDPRRAVIRAYARLEQVLGRHALGRRPFETSLEHLRRALASLRVSGRAAERLASLFELARFSSHDVDTAMKREAVAALAAVRDELEEET